MRRCKKFNRTRRSLQVVVICALSNSMSPLFMIRIAISYILLCTRFHRFFSPKIAFEFNLPILRAVYDTGWRHYVSRPVRSGRVMRFGDEYRREIWATDWVPREKRRRSQVAYRTARRVGVFSHTCRCTRTCRRAPIRICSRRTFRTCNSVRAARRKRVARNPSLTLRSEITSGGASGYRERGGCDRYHGIINPLI